MLTINGKSCTHNQWDAVRAHEPLSCPNMVPLHRLLLLLPLLEDLQERRQMMLLLPPYESCLYSPINETPKPQSNRKAHK